jgi:hypothetical protein
MSERKKITARDACIMVEALTFTIEALSGLPISQKSCLYGCQADKPPLAAKCQRDITRGSFGEGRRVIAVGFPSMPVTTS